MDLTTIAEELLEKCKDQTTKEYPIRSSPCEEVRFLREILYPYAWGVPLDTRDLTKRMQRLRTLLTKGMAIYGHADAEKVIDELIAKLPRLRDVLDFDIEAAYQGDPAAKDKIEVIRSYPGFLAILAHRLANVIYREGCYGYAREIQETVHASTGIDIHPGAQIGAYFFIDHGTGVVIGETTIIGSWVRLYQDVTLGVLHFEKEDGKALKKDYKRHPTLGDHIVVGAGAKILGPVTIGDEVNIGANAWISENIPPKTTVFISEHPELKHRTKDL